MARSLSLNLTGDLRNGNGLNTYFVLFRVTVRPGDTCARVSQLCLTTVRHLIQTVQIGPINPSEAIFNRASCGANNLTPFPQNSIGRFICCRKIPGPERGAQSFAEPPVRMAQIGNC
jgi:hypothetical protein